MINGDKKTQVNVSDKKQALLERNKKIQTEIQSEIDDYKSTALHYGKYALIVGGTFVVTYYLIKTFFSDDEEKSDKKIVYIPEEGNSHKIVSVKAPQEYPVIVKMIMSSIATFLLSIAKEKLVKFLEDNYKNEAQTHTKPTD